MSTVIHEYIDYLELHFAEHLLCILFYTEYSNRANMADHLMLAISHKNYLKKVLTKVTIKVTNKNEMK